MGGDEAELVFGPITPGGCAGLVGMRVVAWVAGGGGQEVAPVHPMEGGDFLGVGVEPGGEVADEDGAEFVFDNAAVGRGGVAVVGDDAHDVFGGGAEFIIESAGDGFFHGFAWHGVATAGPGPDVGPDFFGGGPLGGEKLAGGVEVGVPDSLVKMMISGVWFMSDTI